MMSLLLSYYTIQRSEKLYFVFSSFRCPPLSLSLYRTLVQFSYIFFSAFIYQHRRKLEERKIRPNDDGYGDDDDDEFDVNNGNKRSNDASRETIGNDDLTRSNGFCIERDRIPIIPWNVNEFIIHTQLMFLVSFTCVRSIEEWQEKSAVELRCVAQQEVMCITKVNTLCASADPIPI